MKRASIDIGSNTILLLIVEIHENGFTEIVNESRVTSLGKDLDINKKFIQSSIDDSYSALKEYSELIKGEGISPEKVIVSATEASRVATNSEEFFVRIKSDFGLEVKLINSDGEAFYVAYGVCHGGAPLETEELVIMDIGGASTEFIQVKTNPFKVVKTISLPFGSVRATDWMKNNVFEERMKEILSAPELSEYETDYLVCVAGSMTSLGGMIKGLNSFEPNEINGSSIEFSKFESFVSKIVGLSPEELLSQFPFLGKRAKSIIGGALLGLQVGKRLKISSFEISTLGLRYGTILKGDIDSIYGK